jgi:hypothetical protein
MKRCSSSWVATISSKAARKISSRGSTSGCHVQACLGPIDSGKADLMKVLVLVLD